MWWFIMRVVIAAVIVAAVSEVSQRAPRLGAVLLTLPIVSILAFIMAWTKHHDLPGVARLARETLVLVPLGLAFFVPIGFAERLGLGFWSAFVAGISLAALTIGVWLYFGPNEF